MIQHWLVLHVGDSWPLMQAKWISWCIWMESFTFTSTFLCDTFHVRFSMNAILTRMPNIPISNHIWWLQHQEQQQLKTFQHHWQHQAQCPFNSLITVKTTFSRQNKNMKKLDLSSQQLCSCGAFWIRVYRERERTPEFIYIIFFIRIWFNESKE